MTYFEVGSPRVIQVLQNQISKRNKSLYGLSFNFNLKKKTYDIKILAFETLQNSINTFFRNILQVNTPTNGIVRQN